MTRIAIDDAPSILQRRPKSTPSEPYLEPRSFHGSRHMGWSGHVNFESIGAWVDNRRTELIKLQFEGDFGTLPTNDQLCQEMVDADDPETGLGIKELAQSIAANGLRQPLILSRDGRLLDGNRRYAAMWWLRKTQARPPEDAINVPVWVLNAEPHDPAEEDVITDLNFVGDYKLEWGQYVRARVLYEEWDKGRKAQGGLTVPDLSRRYGWKAQRIRSHLETAALIEEFLTHHNSRREALQLAYEHFIWFEQLHRSNGKLLDEDYEFKSAIFDWLLPPDNEQSRFQQARDFTRLTEIRKNPNAWEALESKTGPGALREAIYVVDTDKIASNKDPAAKLERVTKQLQDMEAKGELDRVRAEQLNEFNELASRVPGAPLNPEARIQKMVEWLEDLRAGDMSELAPLALERLRHALEDVISMVESVRRQRTAGEKEVTTPQR